MPASMAAMKGSCAMCVAPASGVDVLESGLELGEGTLDGERHGRVHFLRDLRGDLVGLRRAHYATLDQDAAKARHGIAPQRRLVLLALTEHRDRLVLRVVQGHAGR